MSGHNKWSTIKHKKAKVDAQRSRVWTKLVKEITVAARMGGGDPDGNSRLRLAIDAGRAANMPNDTIDRAIKKGTGELEGVSYEEITYEGYGPEGVAILVDALTDNRNRTASEIRNIFNKYGGKLGESGSVGWMFSTLGVVRVPCKGVDEDALLMTAAEAGADDLSRDGEHFEVRMDFTALEPVRRALAAAGYAVEGAAITKEPQTSVKVEGRPAEVLLKLLDALEDNDDVREVWANYDIDDELLEQLSA